MSVRSENDDYTIVNIPEPNTPQQQPPMMRSTMILNQSTLPFNNSQHNEQFISLYDNNGWTDEDNDMLHMWANTIKTTSFAYQYILDKGYQISTRLSLISICSSSLLSIFAGFKLWIQDNKAFQSASDITMLFSNFIVAAITTASKRYLDDQKNQKIKAYLEQADQFYALLYTQLSMTPKYRIPAKEFFKKYKDTYTKIMTSMPNVSIKEITIAKNKFIEFEKTINNNDDIVIKVNVATNTETIRNPIRSFISNN